MIRALRLIGRDCIKKRIHVVESGERVPNDILTHILQMACELCLAACICSSKYIPEARMYGVLSLHEYNSNPYISV